MTSLTSCRVRLAVIVSLLCTAACAGKNQLTGKYSNAAGQYVEFKDHNKANLNINGATLEVDYAVKGKEVTLGPANGALVASINDAGCLDLGQMTTAPLCK